MRWWWNLGARDFVLCKRWPRQHILRSFGNTLTIVIQLFFTVTYTWCYVFLVISALLSEEMSNLFLKCRKIQYNHCFSLECLNINAHITYFLILSQIFQIDYVQSDMVSGLKLYLLYRFGKHFYNVLKGHACKPLQNLICIIHFDC